MAGPLHDRLRDAESEKDRWFRERAEQAGRLKRDLENAGREAWNAATRTGRNLSARTPQELEALGAQLLHSRRRMAMPSARRTGSPAIAQGLREAGLQADTVVRGAANGVTFDRANHLSAGLNALAEPGGLEGWGHRYKANLAQEFARDRYDAAHRPLAYNLGRVASAGLGMTLLGPAGGALVAAPRLAGAAALTGREVAALLGGGAAMGLGVQIASDVAAGGRRSTPGDLAGAAVGGAVEVAALPLGPGRAGAVAASTTTALQDVFNDRPVSWARASESALAGHLLGGLAGRAGRTGSNALPFEAKGRLGEALGDIRSRVNLQPRAWGPKSRDALANGYWYPDGRNGAVRFEDKFGTGAVLTPNQARAQAELGPDFRLYQFTPADIGNLLSVPAGAAAPHVVDDRRR